MQMMNTKRSSTSEDDDQENVTMIAPSELPEGYELQVIAEHRSLMVTVVSIHASSIGAISIAPLQSTRFTYMYDTPTS